MQRTDLACSFGGPISYVKFTISYQDLRAIAGAGAKSINLLENPISQGMLKPFLVPQAGVVLYTKIVLRTPFAGGNLNAMTMSAGKSGGNAEFLQAAKDVFNAGGPFEGGMVFSAQTGSWQPNLTFTPTGDAVSAVTAGMVDFYILLVNVSTPDA